MPFKAVYAVDEVAKFAARASAEVFLEGREKPLRLFVSLRIAGRDRKFLKPTEECEERLTSVARALARDALRGYITVATAKGVKKMRRRPGAPVWNVKPAKIKVT